MDLKSFLFLISVVTGCFALKYEMVYDYQADVRTGVAEDAFYASQFVIEAKLHVRHLEDVSKLYFEFTNPSVYVANGKIPFSGTSKPGRFLAFPENLAKLFTEPFVGVYTKPLAAETVGFLSDEPDWMMNIKKSVVSLYQYELGEIENRMTGNQNKTPFSFNIDENSIYGRCGITYDVFPEKYPSEILVSKYFDPNLCSKYPIELYTAYEQSNCKHEHANLINQYMKRSMKLVKNDMYGYMPDYLSGYGKIQFYPFNAKGEQQYVYVNQTFVMTSVKEYSVEVKFEDFKFMENLLFKNNNDDSSMIELSYHFVEGEKKYETPLDICVNGVVDLAQHTDEIDSLYYILWKYKKLSSNDFGQCYEALKKRGQKYLKLFFEVLPAVGTYESVSFSIKLLKENPIPSDFAIFLIAKLPYAVRHPTPEIVKVFYEMIQDDFPIKPYVKDVAILAFGNLVYRAYRMMPTSAPQNWINNHPADVYSTFYYNHLKEAKTYQEQLVWLNGLRNIELGQVWKFILPIMKGDQILNTPYDHHLRIHAVLASERFLVPHHYEFTNVLRLMIRNDHQYLELRTSALSVYLHGATTATEKNQLFWFMHQVREPHFYNFYLTTMKSLAKSDFCNPELHDLAQRNEKLLKYIDDNVPTMSFSDEYMNEEYSVGGKMSGWFVANQYTNELNTFYLKHEPYTYTDHSAQIITYYFKFEGVKNPMKEIMKMMNTKNVGKLKNWSLVAEDGPVHLEMVVVANNRVIYSYVIDEKSFIEKRLNWKQLMTAFNLDSLYITTSVYEELVIPNDLGLSTVMSMYSPSIISLSYDRKPITTQNIAHRFTFTKTVGTKRGIRVFNPFSETWHSVQREMDYHFNFPLMFDVNFESGSDIEINVNWKFFDKNHLEYTSSVRTVTILDHLHDKNYPKLSSDSERFYEVSLDSEAAMHKYEDRISLPFGADYVVDVKCEHYPHVKQFYDNFDIDVWLTKSLSEFGKGSFWRSLNSFNSFVVTQLLSPQYTACNHHVSVVSSESHPIQSMKLNVDFHSEMFSSEHWLIPSEKYKWNGTLQMIKPDEHENVEWVGELTGLSKGGVFFKEFEFKTGRHQKDHPITHLCVKSSKSLYHESSHGEWHMYYGDSFEDECVYDQFSLSVLWNGTMSEDQHHHAMDSAVTYYQCLENNKHLSLHHSVGYGCALAESSYYDYEYKVSYEHVPHSFETFFYNFWTFISTTNHGKHLFENNEHLNADFVVSLHYPMHEEIHYPAVTFKFPHQTFNLHDFYMPELFGSWFYPESTHFTEFFKGMKDVNMVSKCLVTQDLDPEYKKYKSFRAIDLPEHNKWFTVFSGKHEDNDWGIYANHVNSMYWIRFVFNNSTVELQPNMELNYDGYMAGYQQYKYFFDSKMFSYLNHHEDFVEFYNFKLYQVQDSIIMVSPQLAFYTVYNGKQIAIEYVEFDDAFSGMCM